MAGKCEEGSVGDEVMRQRQKAVDREELACKIREAKAVRGPQGRGESWYVIK